MKIRNIHIAFFAWTLPCVILAVGLVSTASAQEYGGRNGTESYGAMGAQNTSMLRAMAQLSGLHEVPAVTSSTTGHAEVNRASGGNLTYSLSVMNGDEITAAHLHCGDPGENGPVVVGLFSNTNGVDVNGSLSSGTISSGAIQGTQCNSTIGYTITTTQELVQAVIAGDIYVNVHSAAHPNGVARGQLTASSYDSPDSRDEDWRDNAEKHWWNNDWWHKNKDGNWYNEHGDTWDGNHNREGYLYSDKDRGDDEKKGDHQRDEDKRRGENEKYTNDYTHEDDRTEGRDYTGRGEKDEKNGMDGRDGKDGNDRTDSNWDNDRNDRDSKRDYDNNHLSSGRDNNSARDWIASRIVERMGERMGR